MALDKELRVKELNTSGSSAVKSIDPYGRHNFFAEQMKEVNGSMDGEMFSKLKKPKYDEKQLLLAVDADVDELIPKAPKDLPDVVLRSEYNALLAELEKANAKIEELNGIISELRSKISDLESQIAGLKSELDASLLRVAVAENSAEASADKFAQAASDLQQAIQKSVAEAIERVSLEAQVEGLVAQKEALISQIGTLEEQVKGKTSELTAGAEAAGDKFTVRVAETKEDDKPDLYYYATRKGTRSPGFRNGPGIILLNTTAEEISVSFEATSWLQAPSSVTIASGESKTVNVSANTGKIKDFKPRKWYHGNDKKYGATLTIKGGGETISLEGQVKKDHG